MTPYIDENIGDYNCRNSWRFNSLILLFIFSFPLFYVLLGLEPGFSKSSIVVNHNSDDQSSPKLTLKEEIQVLSKQLESLRVRIQKDEDEDSISKSSGNQTNESIFYKNNSYAGAERPIYPSVLDKILNNEELSWRRFVEFRSWDGIDLKSPKLCINAQTMWPTHPHFGACGDHVNNFEFWQSLVSEALKVDCVYAGSLTQKRTIFNLPSRNATIYIVFATSAPMFNTGTGVFNQKPYEKKSVRDARLSLMRWSLGRLRAQFGDSLELTVVQLDDSIIDEEDFGIGNVNTVISGTMSEGQDWGMYQEGLHAVWHRIEAFDWVIVLNDQMVGPIANFSQVLDLSKGSGLWTTSAWATCCIRGFAMGFSRSLVKTENWRIYWDRMQFMCAKMGPMYAGEGGVTRFKETQFHRIAGGCTTNSRNPIGKGHSLEKQRIDAPNSPFIYRWGLENEFYPLGDNQLSDNGILEGSRRAIEYIESLKIDPHVEECGVRRLLQIEECLI